MNFKKMTVGGGSSANQNLFVQDRSHAIRKVVKEDFRGVTPAGVLSVLLALPSERSELYINLNDAIVRKALDKIKDRCQVWIDCFGNDGYVIVSARNIQPVRNGLHEVREWMLAQSKELEGKVTTLVHRIGNTSCFCVQLRLTQELGFGTGITDGWRGIAKVGAMEDEEAPSIILAEPFDTAHQNGQNDNKNIVIAKQLLDAIKQASWRPDLGQKYVRVHLGLRSLSKRETKAKARDEYTTPRFRTLMSSATKRGHVSFRLCFGGDNLTKTILQRTHKTDNPENPADRRFVALDATIDHLRDVRPRFCLVFFSGNFRIEMDIHVEPVNATSRSISRGPNRWNLPTASSPRIFRFNKTVDVEISVACPDMKVDWQLSVDSDLSADKIHDKFRVLARELRFDPIPEDGVTFPVVHTSRISLRNANIDSVACKSIWTFQCVNAPCCIDFTEYCDWDAHPLSKHMEKGRKVDQYTFSTTGHNCPLPNKSCAVSLYGEDWDEKMRNMNPASGSFTDDFVSLFDCGFGGEQYISNLLQEIEFLLDMTTKAAEEAECLHGVASQATPKVVPDLKGAARATEDALLIDLSE